MLLEGTPCRCRWRVAHANKGNNPKARDYQARHDVTCRFRGPDHLHGPQQGSDRLKLFESFADHPGFGRIGRVVRELLRHTCMHHTIAKSAN